MIVPKTLLSGPELSTTPPTPWPPCPPSPAPSSGPAVPLRPPARGALSRRWPRRGSASARGTRRRPPPPRPRGGSTCPGSPLLPRLTLQLQPRGRQARLLPPKLRCFLRKGPWWMADLGTSVKGPRRAEVRLLFPSVEVRLPRWRANPSLQRISSSR